MTPVLSVAAFQVSLIWPEAGWVYARFDGADGAWTSPVVGPYTSSSDSWPAGHAVFAVTFTRTYRVVVVPSGTVTVLPVAGSKT